jgi:hypothetical protein
MVRINGKIVNGRTDNEKVLIAYRILHDGLAGNEKLVNLVMSLANQNLGIFMYEKLVKYVHHPPPRACCHEPVVPVPSADPLCNQALHTNWDDCQAELASLSGHHAEPGEDQQVHQQQERR